MHEDNKDLLGYTINAYLRATKPLAVAVSLNNVPEIKRDPKIKQIIFNNPAVVLILDNGKKIVSKAHKEEFDKEKGLLMCLAKLHGITHLELQRMIKNGVDFNKKEN